MVMTPFPKLLNSNVLSQQVEYKEKLRCCIKYTSTAVGVVIPVAAMLVVDSKAPITDTIAYRERILREGVHHWIIRNYTILMLFATKVNDQLT